MSEEAIKVNECGMCSFQFPVPLELFEAGGPCPRCSDECHRVFMSAGATSNVKISIREKAGSKLKRWAREEFMRHELRKDSGHPIGRHMIIDSKNNRYFERVVDKTTGQEIRLVSEPLSIHHGHGSARHLRK